VTPDFNPKMEEFMHDKINSIFEIVDNSEEIVLSRIQDGQVYTYESDIIGIYQEDCCLCFSIIMEEEIILKYNIDDIEKIHNNTGCTFPNITINIRVGITLVIHIF
jgi:hypothetical protein